MVAFICKIELLVNYNHANNMNGFMGKYIYEKNN